MNLIDIILLFVTFFLVGIIAARTMLSLLFEILPGHVVDTIP